MTIYAISGSREFSRLDLVEKVLRKLAEPDLLIFGEARGVDCAAKQACIKLGLAWEQKTAEWKSGDWAGPARNGVLVSNAEKVVVFWDGKSTGANDVIKKARRARKPLLIVFEDGSTRRENEDDELEQATLW